MARRTGEGALAAALLAQAEKARRALVLRALTAAEVAEEVGLSLRQAYRLLKAMREAGIPLEEGPDPRRSPRAREGRIPVVYRLRRT